MRKWMIGVMLVVLAAGIYWRVRPKTSVLADAFIGEPNVTLWSSTAQVHESLGELHWGDSVEVLSRNGNQVKVRTPQKIEGWIESHSLLDAASWQGEKKLFQSSHTMAIQACGPHKSFYESASRARPRHRAHLSIFRWSSARSRRSKSCRCSAIRRRTRQRLCEARRLVAGLRASAEIRGYCGCQRGQCGFC